MRQLIQTPTQAGEIIRGRRKARRISQYDLASKTGISQSRMSILEADPSTLPLERLLLLLKLLGLELVIQDRTGGSGSKAQW
jgi:HTH-type transcriptional regulator/antitoxin HipB